MKNNKDTKNLEWLTENYMSFFEEFGMDEKNLTEYYQTWKEKNNERIEDFLWHIFNHLIYENGQQSETLIDMLERNKKIYSKMLSFRRKIEGKKANEIQRAYNLNEVNLLLESNKDRGLEYEFSIIGDKDCEEYKRISDKRLTIRQALENKTIHYHKCSRNYGCVCSMCIVAKRDKNGRLIFKF